MKIGKISAIFATLIIATYAINTKATGEIVEFDCSQHIY